MRKLFRHDFFLLMSSDQTMVSKHFFIFKSFNKLIGSFDFYNISMLVLICLVTETHHQLNSS